MKSEDTLLFEKLLMQSTIDKRLFGVKEVTIGWYGNKRVDFMIANQYGTIYCYEIKVTQNDFHSKHGHNFVGHYNYYVMPEWLFEEVKSEIPKDVGVIVDRPIGKGLYTIKRSKRRYIGFADKEKLLLYMMRSMSREAKKAFESEDVANLTYWKSKCAYYKKKAGL